MIRSNVPVELEITDDTELLHAPIDSHALSPLRVRLKPVEADQHLLCLHIHHLMSDPATLWTLLDELADLYRGTLPAPAAQFWHYAEDQARLLANSREAAEAWWRRSTELASFAAPSPTPVGPFALRQRVLPASDVAELERFCRRHRSTMFVSLLAGLTTGMLPYLGHGDTVLFTTLISRRNRAEWRSLPGPCIVPLDLPVPRPPSELTGEYVTAVRDIVLGAQQHVMCPTAGRDAPYFEYISDARPQSLSFGDATGAVIDAAGPRDTGMATDLGIRARKTADGELFAHLSGNGIGWSKERTLTICEKLPWRSPMFTEVA
ncbi:condensation domain-containing protein [Kibdelosporangium philippinense]|uniref:Condensation domain-containing protein n=1 Tax=Kibdelosporangium philippinense TaxID=211113 RepID=A0ABS8ZL08_9PSEU|nr:condensation domain-containing protein [Kibdelosporangium philippinense]